jgi:hypothetical protein
MICKRMIDRLVHGRDAVDPARGLKRRFNSDPAQDPLRILIWTPHAKASISRCDATTLSTLIFPGTRLASSSGTAASTGNFSRHPGLVPLLCTRGEEDVVLGAGTETELIRSQLGSAGQVIDTGCRTASNLQKY